MTDALQVKQGAFHAFAQKRCTRAPMWVAMSVSRSVGFS